MTVYSNDLLLLFLLLLLSSSYFVYLCLYVTVSLNQCDAVPDPDSRVILAIRRAEHLKRLVYVSCNAKAAMNNFIESVNDLLALRLPTR